MLNTEKRNPNTYHISTMSTYDIVKTINDENAQVTVAIEKALPEIAKACDAVAAAIQNGGRVFYMGAGTSGRLGVCDAAECPPTFGVSPELFVGIIAGGPDCMFRAAENQEDDPALSILDLQAQAFNKKDVVIGTSASGSASYVIAAVKYAQEMGAVSISITNNPDTELGSAATINICADTGPEVITGSTRMKAGTAQKIIMNMISTTAMVKCGHVHENLMINLKPTNKKLRRRVIRIVEEILHCDEQKAEALLAQHNWSIRAVVDAQV